MMNNFNFSRRSWLSNGELHALMERNSARTHSLYMQADVHGLIYRFSGVFVRRGDARSFVLS